MKVEVSVAVNFIISYLYNKLPRRRVDMLGEELDRCLKAKFQGHWYPDQPLKGTAYRCVRVSGEHPDNVIFAAARECGLDISEIFTYLPEDLTLWIDPNEVSYRIGEKSAIKMLLSERQDSSVNALALANRDLNGLTLLSPSSENRLSPSKLQEGTTFNPEAQVFLPVCRSTISTDEQIQGVNTYGFLSLTSSPIDQQNGSGIAAISPLSKCWSSSPSPTNLVANVPYTGPMNSYFQKSVSSPNFTAASFAQTKFGSTKLKSQGKRPNRLSPNTALENQHHQQTQQQNQPSSTTQFRNQFQIKFYPNSSHSHQQLQQYSTLRSVSLSPHHSQQNLNSFYQNEQPSQQQLEIPSLLPSAPAPQKTDFVNVHIPNAADLLSSNTNRSKNGGDKSHNGCSEITPQQNQASNATDTSNGPAYGGGQLLMAN